jgi:hypothetical protein
LPRLPASTHRDVIARIFPRQTSSGRLDWQIHQSTDADRVCRDVIQRCLDDNRVVPQVADGDIAPRAQKPPNASSAAGLPGVAAPVIMIDMPSLAAGAISAADRALTVLSGEHGVELLQAQSVSTQVEGSRVLRILLAVDLTAFSFVLGVTRTAVRTGRTAEIDCWLLFTTSRACPAGKHGPASAKTLCCRLVLMFRSAVGRPRAACARLVLKRMISDRANPCLGSHNPSIHGQGRIWIYESYSRSVGRLAGRPASANRENCWDTRTTLLSYNVGRKPERERLKISEQGQSAAEPAWISIRQEGSETMYVAPLAGEDMVRAA